MYLCSNGTRVPFEENKAYFVCLTLEKKIALERDYARASRQKIIGMFQFIPPLRPRDKEFTFTTFVPGGGRSQYRIIVARTNKGPVYTSQVVVSRNEDIALENRANPKDTFDLSLLV